MVSARDLRQASGNFLRQEVVSLRHLMGLPGACGGTGAAEQLNLSIVVIVIMERSIVAVFFPQQMINVTWRAQCADGVQSTSWPSL